jgi:hypothetical protein
MTDSVRLGIRWREGEGPGAGYFPFYIGLLLALVSIINLARAWAFRPGPVGRVFVTRPGLRRVLAVLMPFVAYVIALNFVGIYVASALYVALFMKSFGHYSVARGLAVGVAIALALFLLFEVWFLVPLPKGPIEHALGY